MTDKTKLLQQDVIDDFSNTLGTQAWVTVYQSDDLLPPEDMRGIFAIFFPSKSASKLLRHANWDEGPGFGRPGIIEYGSSKRSKKKYFRYGVDTGAEPIIIVRGGVNVQPSRLEVSEQFRLFHDLYSKKKDCFELFHLDENADENLVVRVTDKQIEIRREYLFEYLRATKMALILFLDSKRFSNRTLLENELTSNDSRYIKSDSLILSFSIGEGNGWVSKWRSMSRVLGKKIILPTGMFGGSTGKTYQDFIIGIDSEGKPTRFSSNPNGLADNFGGNSHAPHYLTPVRFRKEVLKRYYDDSKKYEVDAGTLRCKGLWHMSIDQEHDGFVMAYLGDLGRDLPEKEALHWKLFEVKEEGRISKSAYKRDILNQFSGVETLDVKFTEAYKTLNSSWQEKFGWPLYKSLNSEDAHILDSFHVPVQDSPQEFDTQLLALTKLLIDSLNEVKLSEGISLEKDAKGIKKLEAFMGIDITERPSQLQPLKDLQALRSTGIAHRKGSEHSKVRNRMGLSGSSYIDDFTCLLKAQIELLNWIKSQLSNLT